MQPLYRLNCHHFMHEVHTNTCWEEVNIEDDLKLISEINLEGDGFSLKWAVEKLGMQDYFDEGDQAQPFFSEAYLYPLLGKEAARTVLAVLRSLYRKLGSEIML